MKMNKLYLKTLLISILLISNMAYASNNNSIEFFSSNNSKAIAVQTAYNRLVGKQQTLLQNTIIEEMQNNHMAQGRFEDVLGAYEMSTDQNMTADNTEIFYTSPLEAIPDTQVFTIATQLANQLNQDSIAVFIPNEQAAIAQIIVELPYDGLSIDDTSKLINAKLPASYSQAFSLRLNNMYAGYNNTRVKSIEWLGSGLSIDEIKNAFPQAMVAAQNGSAYLVYKTGTTQQL